MRINQPVSQIERYLGVGEYIASKTNLKGKDNYDNCPYFEISEMADKSISQATMEQETSMNHVSSAILQINDLAQHSVFSAEELAAAAGETSFQSQQLQRLMACFRSDEGGGWVAER